MTLLSNYAGNQITRAGSALSKSVYNTYLAGLSSNAAGQVTLSSNNNISSTQYLVKLDHTLSEKNHLSGRYFITRTTFSVRSRHRRDSSRRIIFAISRSLSATRMCFLRR